MIWVFPIVLLTFGFSRSILLVNSLPTWKSAPLLQSPNQLSTHLLKRAGDVAARSLSPSEDGFMVNTTWRLYITYTRKKHRNLSWVTLVTSDRVCLALNAETYVGTGHYDSLSDANDQSQNDILDFEACMREHSKHDLSGIKHQDQFE